MIATIDQLLNQLLFLKMTISSYEPMHDLRLTGAIVGEN